MHTYFSGLVSLILYQAKHEYKSEVQIPSFSFHMSALCALPGSSCHYKKPIERILYKIVEQLARGCCPGTSHCSFRRRMGFREKLYEMLH